MIHVDSQGQGGWKRIVSLNEDHPDNLDLVPHLDVTWSEAEATGIDPDDEPDLTYEEMGYSQAVLDDRETDFEAYTGQDPTGLAAAPCEFDCEDESPPPPSDSLNRSFNIYRQQNAVWCVPAIVQSMLQNLRPASENWSGGGTITGVKNRQQDLVDDILAARNAKKNPDISVIPKKNGIGTRWGLKVLNDELLGSYTYVEARASSVSNLRQRIKFSINANDVPAFVEINLRSKQWEYTIGPNKTSVLTHATAAFAYAICGASFTVADPYLTPTAAAAREWQDDHYTVEPWGNQPAGPNGKKWTISDLNLHAALAKVTNTGFAKNNIWY